jgi:hypothetical protein
LESVSSPPRVNGALVLLRFPPDIRLTESTLQAPASSAPLRRLPDHPWPDPRVMGTCYCGHPVSLSKERYVLTAEIYGCFCVTRFTSAPNSEFMADLPREIKPSNRFFVRARHKMKASRSERDMVASEENEPRNRRRSSAPSRIPGRRSTTEEAIYRSAQ